MSSGNIEKFHLFRKAVITVAVCSTIIAVSACIFDYFDLWEKLSDYQALSEWINSKGKFSILIYAVLVFCSVIFLPIPSTVMNYLATVLFDNAWITFIVTSVATIAGSFVCYFLGKIFGKRLVIWFAGKEKTEKYSRVINENGKFLFVMMLLLPFFPDDVLCLIAGASSMSLPFFALSTVLARPVMIAVVSFLGKSATDAMDTWGLPVGITVIVFVVIAAALLAFFKIRKKKKDLKPSSHCRNKKSCISESSTIVKK